MSAPKSKTGYSDAALERDGAPTSSRLKVSGVANGPLGFHNALSQPEVGVPGGAGGVSRHCHRSAAVPSRSMSARSGSTNPRAVLRGRCCCGWGQPRSGYVPKGKTGGSAKMCPGERQDAPSLSTLVLQHYSIKARLP